MPALMCARPEADKLDYANERFIVCKWIGVTAGGRKFEMGDELPKGTLSDRAMREIYDTPMRLIETFEYALQDEELLAAMMRRIPSVDMPDDDDDDSDEEDDDLSAKSVIAPVVEAAAAPKPLKKRIIKDKKRS